MLSLSLGSCKKDKKTEPEPEPAPAPAPPAAQRVVKYEITGNYSGKLTIVYTNATGVNETITGISLPWTKEVTVTKQGAVSVGFTAATPVSQGSFGVSGQTAVARLYANSVEKQNATQTADNNGAVMFGVLSHVFY